MSPLSSLAGIVLAGFLSVFASVAAAAPAKNANLKSHAHHLLQAEQDLVAAEASLVASNAQQAHKHVAAALNQVEQAIQHHHKHHIAQPANTGLSGTVTRAQHHKHHATLQQAATELRAAEKLLSAGNASAASKDIVKASKTIKAAVASHNHLIKP